MYASSSRKNIQIAIHIVEGMGGLGKSKEVMIWLRLGCDFRVVSLKCVDMLNTLPITCLLMGIGSSINTIAEDYLI